LQVSLEEVQYIPLAKGVPPLSLVPGSQFLAITKASFTAGEGEWTRLSCFPDGGAKGKRGGEILKEIRIPKGEAKGGVSSKEKDVRGKDSRRQPAEKSKNVRGLRSPLPRLRKEEAGKNCTQEGGERKASFIPDREKCGTKVLLQGWEGVKRGAHQGVFKLRERIPAGEGGEMFAMGAGIHALGEFLNVLGGGSG